MANKAVRAVSRFRIESTMVKQGSFFQRLKDRWGSTSGVRVDRSGAEAHRGGAGGASNGGSRPVSKPAARPATVERIEPGREIATGAPAEARSSRKMSEREEALLALSTHFQELTGLLRGSHAKVDGQLEKLVTATGSLAALPAVSEQQLATLKAISAHMERQNALGEQMATTVTRLPSLLENVEKALERAAATDERTAATVKEFHSTMDRIHGSMAKMVEQNGKQAEATQKLAQGRDDTLKGIATGIETSQKEALSKLERTTDESLKSLRRTHEDQSNRLQKVVESHANWNRAVIIGIGLVVVGIGALIVLQLVK